MRPSKGGLAYDLGNWLLHIFPGGGQKTVNHPVIHPLMNTVIKCSIFV